MQPHRGNKRKMPPFWNSRWTTLAPLLLAGRVLTFPSGFPILLRIALRLSNRFWAFPSSFPLPFYKAVPSGCPTASKSMSHRLSAKMWYFPSLFLWRAAFPLPFSKSQRRLWNIIYIKPQRLLSKDRTIQQYNFQPVSISCDSPLKLFFFSIQ